MVNWSALMLRDGCWERSRKTVNRSAGLQPAERQIANRRYEQGEKSYLDWVLLSATNWTAVSLRSR
ncbi:MAG: hypothetical protein JWO95_3532 [Verrucomicrobiales bacterium]|nr:hypothetical protein [Verrucomicrobiales bacterium]